MRQLQPGRIIFREPVQQPQVRVKSADAAPAREHRVGDAGGGKAVIGVGSFRQAAERAAQVFHIHAPVEVFQAQDRRRGAAVGKADGPFIVEAAVYAEILYGGAEGPVIFRQRLGITEKRGAQPRPVRKPGQMLGMRGREFGPLQQCETGRVVIDSVNVVGHRRESVAHAGSAGAGAQVVESGAGRGGEKEEGGQVSR